MSDEYKSEYDYMHDWFANIIKEADNYMKRGRKFTEGKLSVACADQFVNRHTSCSMQKCICCCHLSISEQNRIKGLRT
jgi:hypothetical protein